MSVAQDFKRFLQGHANFEESYHKGDTVYSLPHRFNDTGITVQVIYLFDSDNLWAECAISGFGTLDDSFSSYRLLDTLNGEYRLGKFYRMDNGVVIAKTARSVSDLGLDCQAFFDDSIVLLKTVESAAKEIMRAKWS